MVDDVTPQDIDWKAVIAQVDEFWDTFSEATVERFRELGAPTIRYSTPLGDVAGIDAVIAFLHAWFKKVDQPRFQILGRARDGNMVYSHWRRTFLARNGPKSPVEAQGMSTWSFDAQGRLVEIIDYWDSAQILATLPVLGRVFGLGKRLLR
jgi:YD repeat-containing protein